jgi:hypothetical protein
MGLISWGSISVSTFGAIRSPGAIALITGLAVVLGAVVGGASTGIVTYKIEQLRQQFETRNLRLRELRNHERELKAVRGAARLWERQLRKAHDAVRVSIHSGWWSDEMYEFTPPSIDDEKLVAGEALDEEWAAIRDAMRSVEVCVGIRMAQREEAGLAGTAFGPDVPKADYEYLDGCLARVSDGVRALEAIASRQPHVDI